VKIIIDFNKKFYRKITFFLTMSLAFGFMAYCLASYSAHPLRAIGALCIILVLCCMTAGISFFALALYRFYCDVIDQNKE